MAEATLVAVPVVAALRDHLHQKCQSAHHQAQLKAVAGLELFRQVASKPTQASHLGLTAVKAEY